MIDEIVGHRLLHVGVALLGVARLVLEGDLVGLLNGVSLERIRAALLRHLYGRLRRLDQAEQVGSPRGDLCVVFVDLRIDLVHHRVWPTVEQLRV